MSLPSGDKLFAFIEMVMALLTRDELSAEERAFVERFRLFSERYGEYLLEAGDREDLQARVDAVLEDPQFHQDHQRLNPPLTPAHFAEVARGAEGGRDMRDSEWARALGPASIPSMRKLDACMMEIGRCLGIMLAQRGATLTAQMPPELATAHDPLAFLSNPSVPVPLARALLSGFRSNALLSAVCAVRFGQKSLEGWLGLALAETLAKEMRGTLALVAAATGTEVPVDILPLDERLDMLWLFQSSQSVQQGYLRFNADAERSGEPVYPSDR